MEIKTDLTGKAYEYMDWPRIEAVVYSEEASPRDVMMPRITQDGILIQGYFPEAEEAWVISGRKTYPMELEDDAGYFAVMIPGRKVPSYRYRVRRGDAVEEFCDAYSFPGQITEEEEKAFCAGVYYHAYEKLGAHPMKLRGTEGTLFAVWAPNALRVSVVGDFNGWDGRKHMMHRLPMSGIFELFVPGVKEGASYQYEIKKKGGELLYKTDPYASRMLLSASCVSVVTRLEGYSWKDAAWTKARRKRTDRDQPLSIYETSLTEWESPEDLIGFVSGLRYTHVELLPVMEYLDERTGGYSTLGYFAPSGRFGTPRDFQRLVDGLHQAGVGVILDWTPAHFPNCPQGLEMFDGTPLYEEPDPAQAVHPMWGTLLFQHRSPMVTDFLISDVFYWIECYHVDGFRFDDVDAMLYLDYGRGPGQWKPNIYGGNENLSAVEFLKHLNSIVKKKYPQTLLIAQEDGLWPELTDSVENDHIGFDYKWSGGWTGDLLSYLSAAPENRRERHDQLTVSMLYAYCEHYILTLGKRDVGNLAEFLKRLPGTEEERTAQARLAYTYLMLHPGGKMTAPGTELSDEMKDFFRDLNDLYRSQPALSVKDNDYDGFEWIQLMMDEQNVIAFLRRSEKPEETLLAVLNFSPNTFEAYRVGVPFQGRYKEIFNSDRKIYGGSGAVNPRMRSSRREECDEREESIRLRVPAMGAVVVSCTPSGPELREAGRIRKTDSGRKAR